MMVRRKRGKRGERGHRETSFYAISTNQENAPESEVQHARRRLLDVVYRQPGDVRLVLRGTEVLTRAMNAERAGSHTRDLAKNMQRTLDSLGDQFLPAEE